MEAIASHAVIHKVYLKTKEESDLQKPEQEKDQAK